MNGILDGILLCGAHELPMLEIDDSYVCPQGYLAECTGEAVVVNIEPSPAGVRFSNGWFLPLLCACCGRPLHIKMANVDISYLLGTVVQVIWDGADSQKISLIFLDDEVEAVVDELDIDLASIRLLRGPDPD